MLSSIIWRAIHTDSSVWPYPLRDESVIVIFRSVYSAPVTTWRQIREHYARALQQSTRNQVRVAEAGELQQSAVSKLLANSRLGPSVETFVRAVEGLGMPLSEFFASLERREIPVPRHAHPSPDDDRALEIGRAILKAIQSPSRRRRN
jgi:transcriptional regulator with XRE-family HTH domain